MPARVTDAQVRTHARLGATDPVQAAIDTATIRVDALIGTGQSDAKLTLIELWLASHYAVLAVPSARLTGHSQGGQSISASGQFGKGLDATVYGQTAKGLDSSGTLAAEDAAATSSAAPVAAGVAVV